MSPSQCPEDLLVLDGRRTLTAAEERALLDHIGTCESCRMSQALRSRIEPLPMLEAMDAAFTDRWVTGALSTARRSTEKDRPAPVDGGAVRTRKGRLGLWLAAALLMSLLASLAGAAWHQFSSLRRTPKAVAPKAVSPGRSTRPLPAGTPLTPLVPSLSTSSLPSPSAAPAAPTKPASSSGLLVTPMQAAREAESGAAPETPAAEGAAGLFSAANRARRDRRFTDALRLYDALQTSFPRSREATLSLLSVADVLLAQGRPNAALDKFDAYLARSDGVLAEEALVGRARCLSRLTRSMEERATWQALLARYPKSTYGWRARQRIEELGANDR